MLVVDHDESLQNLFKLFLKKIGFSRVVVGTVKEALNALDKQHFDLLFLDLKLPDGPADDVYAAAKAADSDMPIVIITGYPDSRAVFFFLGRELKGNAPVIAMSGSEQRRSVAFQRYTTSTSIGSQWFTM